MSLLCTGLIAVFGEMRSGPTSAVTKVILIQEDFTLVKGWGFVCMAHDLDGSMIFRCAKSVADVVTGEFSRPGEVLWKETGVLRGMF